MSTEKGKLAGGGETNRFYVYGGSKGAGSSADWEEDDRDILGEEHPSIKIQNELSFFNFFRFKFNIEDVIS